VPQRLASNGRDVLTIVFDSNAEVVRVVGQFALCAARGCSQLDLAVKGSMHGDLVALREFGIEPA
jgi:hypothetical protein